VPCEAVHDSTGIVGFVSSWLRSLQHPGEERAGFGRKQGSVGFCTGQKSDLWIPWDFRRLFIGFRFTTHAIFNFWHISAEKLPQ